MFQRLNQEVQFQDFVETLVKNFPMVKSSGSISESCGPISEFCRNERIIPALHSRCGRLDRLGIVGGSGNCRPRETVAMVTRSVFKGNHPRVFVNVSLRGVISVGEESGVLFATGLLCLALSDVVIRERAGQTSGHAGHWPKFRLLRQRFGVVDFVIIPGSIISPPPPPPVSTSPSQQSQHEHQEDGGGQHQDCDEHWRVLGPELTPTGGGGHHSQRLALVAWPA